MKEDSFKGIIYKATNIINGKVYIGQTIKGLDKRKSDHLADKRGTGYFHSSLKSYGKENFIWEIIDEAETREELDEKEKEWIWLNYSNNKQYGYNLTEGGNGNSGSVHSEETRAKMSLAGKGKKKTEEHKQKISNAHKGKKHSEESLLKMSLSQKGKTKGRKQSKEEIQNRTKSLKGQKRTPEQNKRNSNAHKGLQFTEEHRRNISKSLKGRVSPNKGNALSEESKRKISEAGKGRKLSDATKKKMKDSHIGREYPKRGPSKCRGQKRTDAQKQKMSLAKKGKKNSKSHCENISKAKKGQAYLIEAGKLLGKSNIGKIPWNKGVKQTEEVLIKLSAKRKGRRKMTNNVVTKLIQKKDIDKYLQDGWKFCTEKFPEYSK